VNFVIRDFRDFDPNNAEYIQITRNILNQTVDLKRFHTGFLNFGQYPDAGLPLNSIYAEYQYLAVDRNFE
jgi:hypothetical protein